MELRTRPRKIASPPLVNLCAQCGQPIYMPQWSEYLHEHRVRHLWACEQCDYKFETLVYFPED